MTPLLHDYQVQSWDLHVGRGEGTPESSPLSTCTQGHRFWGTRVHMYTQNFKKIEMENDFKICNGLETRLSGTGVRPEFNPQSTGENTGVVGVQGRQRSWNSPTSQLRPVGEPQISATWNDTSDLYA